MFIMLLNVMWVTETWIVVLQRVGEIPGKFLGIYTCLQCAHPVSQLGQLLTCELGPEVEFPFEYLI